MDMEPGESAVPPITVGVVSDTHGHLYPEVKHALAGVDHIIHAGDVGSARVLADLRALAPITAIRGNCDVDAWADVLPARAELDLGGARILVGHIAARLQGCVDAAGDGPDTKFSVVISGHSHLAALEHREGILYLNPGSAGPSRFGRPRTVGRLTIRPQSGSGSGAADVSAEIVIVPS